MEFANMALECWEGTTLFSSFYSSCRWNFRQIQSTSQSYVVDIIALSIELFSEESVDFKTTTLRLSELKIEIEM